VSKTADHETLRIATRKECTSKSRVGIPLSKRKKSNQPDEEDEVVNSRILSVQDSTLQDTPEWYPTTFDALLEDSSTHDVTFKTSDGGSMSAHRVIVAAGSPVFHAMLYGN